MKVGKRSRGPFEKCLLSYVKDRLDGRDDLVKDRIFVTHTPCDAKTVEAVKKSVKQYGGFSQVVETQAGCTISSHCGPNTLCVVYSKVGVKDNGILENIKMECGRYFHRIGGFRRDFSGMARDCGPDGLLFAWRRFCCWGHSAIF